MFRELTAFFIATLSIWLSHLTYLSIFHLLSLHCEEFRKYSSDEGVCITVVPSPFMKLMWFAFFYPKKLARRSELIMQKNDRSDLLRRLRKGWNSARGMDISSNNPHRKRLGFFRRQIWPIPDGAYDSNAQEFIQFQKGRWIDLIESAGFETVRVVRMPVTTGYRIDWRPVLSVLERLGLASGYPYFAVKRNLGKMDS